jgi:hypothetical protein
LASTNAMRLAGVRNSASSVPLMRSNEKCQADWTSEKKNVYANAPAPRNASSRTGSVTSGQRWAAAGEPMTGSTV